MKKQPRQHDEKHLAFLRTLPCLPCGAEHQTEAAHIRMSVAGVKVNPGVGAKPDDKWALPQCGACHREQHAMSERRYWECKGIDPIAVAQELYAASGDHAAGCRIVTAARLNAQPMNILAAG